MQRFVCTKRENYPGRVCPDIKCDGRRTRYTNGPPERLAMHVTNSPIPPVPAPEIKVPETHGPAETQAPDTEDSNTPAPNHTVPALQNTISDEAKGNRTIGIVTIFIPIVVVLALIGLTKRRRRQSEPKRPTQDQICTVFSVGETELSTNGHSASDSVDIDSSLIVLQDICSPIDYDRNTEDLVKDTAGRKRELWL